MRPSPISGREADFGLPDDANHGRHTSCGLAIPGEDDALSVLGTPGTQAVFLSDMSLWKDAGAGSDRPITFGDNLLLLENIIGYATSLSGCTNGIGVYCTSAANTNGVSDISSSALTVPISDPPPQLQLSVDNLPVLNATCQPEPQPGFFIASAAPAVTPFFNGTLCLEQVGLQRLKPVLVPDASGMVRLFVDLATQAQTLAGGCAPVNVVPGAQYYFQYWTRDPCALMQGEPTAANFSSAIAVCFEP